MSQWEKLLAKMRRNPKSIRFEELAKVLKKYDYIMHQPHGGSSHHTFRKAGCKPITIPYHRPYVNEMYVHLVLEVLTKEGLI